MEVYRVDDDDMTRIEETELDTEAALENRLVKARGAEIGGVELLYIARQDSPGDAGIFDILAVDSSGNTVVVELKRDKAPREIVAQALEYASEVRNEDYDALDERYETFLQDHYGIADERPSLAEAHAEYFDLDEPLSRREFNSEQRFVLVGTSFRDVSLSMADFLRAHEIDVVCVEYRAYREKLGGLELLTTDGIRRPLSEEPNSVTRSSSGKEYVDYSNLIIRVRDQIFPQIDDQLQLEEPEELAEPTQKRNLKVKSNHPTHPESIIYGMSPRLVEDGFIRIAVSVWDEDDEIRREIYSVLKQHIDDLDGYEITDNDTKSTHVIKKEFQIEANDLPVTDTDIRAITDELVQLISVIHPRMVDQFRG